MSLAWLEQAGILAEAKRAEKETDEQKETRVVLENVAHESTKACSTAALLGDVLVLSNSMSELAQNV